MAGTKRSNTFARLFVYPVIEKMHQNIPNRIVAHLRCYVDDIALAIFGRFQDAVPGAIFLARKLFALLASAELVVSRKSTAVSSDPEALKRITSALAAEGLNLASARSAKGLGIDAPPGKRAAKTLNKRAAATKLKASKLRFL